MGRKLTILQKRIVALLCVISMLCGTLFSDMGVIVANAAEPITFWNFKSAEFTGSENGIKIQNDSGEFKGLLIDATAQGACFDCGAGRESNWAQVNVGTSIKVPVQGVCKLELTWMNEAACEVDGVAKTGTVITAISDGTQEYMEFVRTSGNQWLGSIRVTKYVYASEGLHSFANASETVMDGFSAYNMGANNNSHGWFTAKADATITVNLEKKADVEVEGCCYVSNGTDCEMTSSSGSVETIPYQEDLKSSGNDANRWVVTNASAGELVLTFSLKNIYIHSVKITYHEEGTTGDLEDTTGDREDVTGDNEDKYDITVTNDGNGTASASAQSAKAGEVITLTPTPAAGFVFDKWEVVSGDVTINGNTFRMPAGAVSVKACFKEAAAADLCVTVGEKNFSNLTAVNIQGIKAEGFNLSSKNDHGILTTAGATLTLSLLSEATITVTTCGYCAGTNAVMTVPEGSNKQFTKSEADVGDGSANPGLIYTVKGVQPGDFVMTFGNNVYIHKIDIKYEVAQVEKKYSVTVTAGEGGTASASRAEAYKGETVTLDYSRDRGVNFENAYVFKGWEVVRGNVVIDSKHKFAMPEEDVEIKAVFEKIDGTEYAKEKEVPLGSVSKVDEFGVIIGDGFAYGNGHGIHSLPDDAQAGVTYERTITFNLENDANITVLACRYGTGTSLMSSSGKVTSRMLDESGADAPEFTVLGAKAGQVVLTVDADMYLHNFSVEYLVDAEGRNIEVWDFGGKLETDTETYTNHITPAALIASGLVAKGGTMSGGNTSFGDLTMNTLAGDLLYTQTAALSDYNKGSYSLAQYDFGNGYKADGAWYCNGTGGTTRRYITISHVQAGDKILVYGGISQNGPSELIFDGQGAASGQTDKIAVEAGKFAVAEFIAQKPGRYKIYESGAGKPMYHRVVRVPAVKVSGTIDFGPYSGDGHEVQFLDLNTERITKAELDGANYTVNLAAGHDYLAILNKAVGYGFTKDSRNLTTTDAQALTGITGKNLVVEEKEAIAYTGHIVGFAEGYERVSDLRIRLVADRLSGAVDEMVEIGSDLSFEAHIQPDIAYTITISGVNDYEVKNGVTIKKEEDYHANIEVGLKDMQSVTGGFVDLDGEKVTNVTKLTFKNLEDSYTYEAQVNENGYSISLRDGSYLAQATASGFTTGTHVVVNGADVEKDLLFAATAKKESVAFASDIYVGYKDKENNYSTMREAMDACERMDPQPTADNRVTVHIAPGTYREQIVVNTPYISFVKDEDQTGEVLITWYYGIGYKYYSADAKGFYNPENAYDQFDKHIADRWGCTVRVTSAATAFRAEGITFENSFNRYITDEEIADGAECAGTGNTTVARDYSADVMSKGATERAAAMALEGQLAEFRNCKFLSSQDTLYTQAKSYFKNCFIEGQTDYIFGSGNIVFDTCELSFKGYSANSQGGYITAADPMDGQKGYLFRNCAVTGNAKLTVTAGYFGRPWGDDANVTFLNTKLQKADLIDAAGWYKMTVDPEAAYFYEYNTTTMSGEAVNTSSRKGNVLDKTQAEAIRAEDYFGDWTPAFYQAEAAELQFVTDPKITDNGDLNTPYPGHRLTVGYSLGEANDANDMSRIEWYRVDETNNKETLVKTSTAATDKSYKIAKADVGCKIKVVVTPETVSGRTAEPKECITVETVRDGFEDPEDTSGGAALGDGVNIFLTGDSTVCLYPGRNEGSWGECFQNYFDSDKVTVVDYANGGRSARSFINEKKLEKIKSEISEGDYLFIQFGHNDCADEAEYKAERFEPLGEPDGNGIYPTTPGVKVATPSELSGNGYGSECYTWDCGGTYKWYLKQYIDVAKEAGAIPVLVTPVSRMYYNSDGTIKPHHDASSSTNKTNSYVTAVKQLGAQEDVLVIDGFELTKTLLEDAYKAGGQNYGKQIMFKGDSTHCNKLGGMVEAAAIVSALLDVRVNDKPLSIAYAMKKPARAGATTTDGKTVFNVDGNGRFTAYNLLDNYESEAEYWTRLGQSMFDNIGDQLILLNGGKLTCTVTFETNGGSAVAPQTVEKGQTATRPDAPEMANHIFKGWYSDEACKTEYDFSAAVTENITLYAKWEAKAEEPEDTHHGDDKEYVTVTFETNGGSAVAPQTVEKGQTATRPDAPEKANHIFKGWYSDEACKAEYDFSAAVTENITLYAKWEAKQTDPDLPDIPDDSKGIMILDLEESYLYTGAKIVPEIRVADCDRQVILIPGTDYTVAYKNNQKISSQTKDGAATVIVTGKGNYAGKGDSKTFKIVEPEKPADLELADLKGAKIGKIDAVTYNGEAQYPEKLILTLKGKDAKTYLYSDGEYETEDGEKLPALWTISGNKNKGTATILLTGAVNGSKATTLKASFKINAVDMNKEAAKFEVSREDAIYHVKGAAAQNVVVTWQNGEEDVILKEGVDYTVKYTNNKKVCENAAGIVITGKGNFAKKIDSKVKTDCLYSVKQMDLSETEIVAVKAAAGMKLSKVTAVVNDPEGNALKAKKQYELVVSATRDGAELAANDKLAEGDVVTVKAKAGTDGNTTGETAEVEVTAGIDFSKAKAVIVKVTNEKGKPATKTWSYTGEAIEPEGSDLEVTVKGVAGPLKIDEDYEIVGCTNNIKKGTATVILAGKGSYSGYKTVKFKIVAKSMK